MHKKQPWKVSRLGGMAMGIRASVGYRRGAVDVTGAPVKSNMIVLTVQLWGP